MKLLYLQHYSQQGLNRANKCTQSVFVPNLVLTNIYNAFLPHRWPKHALAAAVQLGHDDVLGLVGRGAGGEVDADGSVAFLWERHQEVVVDHRLAGSCGSHNQNGHFM